nr:FkbM family methyltransferase [Rhodohalobacter sulfatireducens]
MISYAQNFEDVVLNRVFHNVDSGRYVDVGAYHPEIDSVTKHFYNKGWSGINIEPIDRFWQLFQEMRPRDQNVRTAIGSYEGHVEFHEFGDTGLSGYGEQPDIDILEALEVGMKTKNLPITTLAQIADKFNLSEVEFLKIDVEGAERDVLLGTDFKIFRPKVIVIEAIKPKLPGVSTHAIIPTWPNFENILFENDYEFGLFDGLNRFYFRSESPELQKLLSYPANITDGFILNSNHFLVPNNDQKKESKKLNSIPSIFKKLCKRIISNFRGGK